MKYCAICNKRLTILNTGIGSELKTGDMICLTCLKKLDNNTIANLKELTGEDLANKILENKQKEEAIRKRALYAQDIEKIKLEHAKKANKIMVVEYKRTCNQCGKVWHVLAEREKYLEKEKNCNDCNMCASAVGSASGNPYSMGTWTQSRHNEHTLNDEITRLKQCPNCMSSDYSEVQVKYEK